MQSQPAHTAVQAEEAHLPNHPDKGAATVTKITAESKGFEARKAEKEAKLKERLSHSSAIAKYEADLESKIKRERQAAPPTVGKIKKTTKTEISARNAVPIVDSDKTGEVRAARLAKRSSRFYSLSG